MNPNLHRAYIGTLLILLSACSRHPSNRFDLSGTVTFNGQPVPAGLIVINPDISKGNDGPQGLAEIKNGRFDTRHLEKGAPSGPVILLINGFDGAALPDSPSGKPLFLTYKLRLDLPQESSEQNIEIPASAAANVKAAPLP
jgi:hypothetical protein